MSNRPTTDQKTIRQIVADYVQQYGITTTRQIAEYVESEIGDRPSPTTIAKILDELGYSAHQQPRFVWKHKKDHE